MAWTSTGSTIASYPWLVRKLVVTPDSTTATAITHGGPAQTPDMILFALTKTNPTASEVSTTASSTTTVTFDVEGATNPFTAYVFFFNQAAGGVS